MSCFPLPEKVTSKIDSIQRTFWWSKKDPRHAAYYRSWGDIGRIKGSRADFGLTYDAFESETSALVLVVNWVREMNLPKVFFVSDCLQLVEYFQRDCVNISWRSSDLLEDCRCVLSSNQTFKVMYIKHVKNRLVDRLARRARKLCIKNKWVSFPLFWTLL
ncbi:uncharacterized protein LOC113300431 [Papaver somniferum]|uniref:uncharacterized protein LOC113300431 n=1 Tax=Papaver somniferum TaxID=3469 RepID=UPI000E6FD0FC|nr:uncharacterized protein LOC113300431 [Papaver somniferum]